MSWFDAAGFANLAKSALKEAQKTIDKALDIKEEEQKVIQASPADTTDFFATWGLKSEEEQQDAKDKPSDQKQQTSIWGSFTGSFFDNPKLEQDSSNTVKHSKSLQEAFSEDLETSQIVTSISVPESLLNQSSSISKSGVDSESTDVLNELTASVLLSKDTLEYPVQDVSKELCSYDANTSSDLCPFNRKETATKSRNRERSNPVKKANSLEECDLFETTEEHEGFERRRSNDETGYENDSKINEIKRRELSANHTLNRISVISSESDKKSSESVEVLGSRSTSDTDCTTTPESDINSVSNSISSSAMGLKVNSESVEVLPDSLVTSPSSVEILCDWKSDSSPFVSPMDQKQFDASPNPVRGESVTPSVDPKNELLPQDNEERNIASCSDISPYESPLEETKTLNISPCPDNASVLSSSISPVSPTQPDLSQVESNKVSPESVEVIPDIDESDEVSLAEDSYTSASESTVMTVMETFQQLDPTKTKIDLVDRNLKMHDSCPDSRQILMKPGEDNQLNLSLDSLKEKHNLHLPLEPITTQPIRKAENLESVNKVPEVNPFDQLKCSTIEPPDPETFRDSENQLQKAETIDVQDQYLMLTDSSCEGTLIESSSEDNATLICEPETKITETPLTASSYVKNMLADAMVEKGEIIDLERHCMEVPRENSPISSESRSDLVKIGSDQTSGHTSGDELETTTSSDIEIISSPNGDSSSTQSRQSPAKLQLNKSSDLLTKTLNKTRGHSRELSEISVGSDDANLEIEKLLKRIQEMTEILEARESKLIDISRMNMELHDQNNNLKKKLDNIEKCAEQNQELTQITDEYTQRLSALERKFQQAIRERDTLRKHVEQLKQEAATRLSSQEISTINAEKDEIIRELREEGEKLSKQQLQHSNIIKKLRIKEKENDVTIKNQKEQIEEQTLELDRLKRSLYAKEEVERSQIEAVHMLTAKTKKQEKEILSLQERLDDALQKMDTYKRSLDAAKTELADTKDHLSAIEEDLKEAVDNAGESCQLSAQIEDLKMRLRQTKEAHIKREESLKQENIELLKRLEAAEARSEELSESVSMATKPMLRQLEQLQSSLSHKSTTFMKQEKTMSEKIIELQTKLDSLIEVDRSLKEENVSLKSKVSVLESKFNAKEAERVKLEALYEQIKQKSEKITEENEMQRQMIETLEQSHSNKVKELKREINSLENKLSMERAATDAEKRKNNAMLEQQQSVEEELRLSPTLSIGRDSIGSTNSVWPAFNDSVFDTSSGRFPNVYDSIRSGSTSTSMFENLQAQLKQRDGEVQQLQWELSRRNVERDTLNMELSTLALKVEELTAKVSEVETLNENLNDIQTKYDALLQMYGEKVEENQELRLDLQDVKDMYKSQIDQLLKRDA
ncbi:TATA element modulatory factor isoform X2 [Cephus cinctus]|uniref:TATA element modulatory factor isoform X2 n=1 Tax=Cephus cinctus TaxID=211228 RepID=A0AAJ7BVA1_CEPCN|nr:TATA element modulatory factor isoform X2 [Cephus cinctus]